MTTNLTEKPDLSSPTILLCPNLIEINAHGLSASDQVLVLHAPNLESLG